MVTADDRGAGKWWHLNLTPSVAKMLDWYVRHFHGEAYGTIGEIQQQAHTKWEVPAADALRSRGFRVAVVGDQPYPGVPTGVVLRQSPQAGFQIAPGEPISLEVSR